MMNLDAIKQDVLSKIKNIAERDGKAPGSERFQAETGIKPHEWRGRFWRQWSDALTEAGFAPNSLQTAFSDDNLLQPVLSIAKALGRFPSTGDIQFEMRNRTEAPGPKTILARWRMAELASALADYAERHGEQKVAGFARSYVPPRQSRNEDVDMPKSAVGHVYMQRHGSDYKIGYTKSLNKRGRQIQIELPREIELVHSILTDDPVGVEAYWHRRFAAKRIRGEWFKLTRADIAAFKRWSKIW